MRNVIVNTSPLIVLNDLGSLVVERLTHFFCKKTTLWVLGRFVEHLSQLHRLHRIVV